MLFYYIIQSKLSSIDLQIIKIENNANYSIISIYKQKNTLIFHKQNKFCTDLKYREKNYKKSKLGKNIRINLFIKTKT